jgi:hypothetical protein
MVSLMWGCVLDSDSTVETSHRHKKEHNGEQELAMGKLSRVSDDKLTSEGKQALNEMTKKATGSYAHE